MVLMQISGDNCNILLSRCEIIPASLFMLFGHGWLGIVVFHPTLSALANLFVHGPR